MTVAAGRLEVETPDHVVLRYDLAGAGNRGFAAVLDFLIASLIAVTAAMILLLLGAASPGGLLLFSGLAVIGPTAGVELVTATLTDSPPRRA